MARPRTATHTLSTLKSSARKILASARTRTAKTVNHLENVFEKRVSQTVARLGVPTAKEVRALSQQVAQLQASVERLRRSRARA
jgi:poly(hydroxyalkanoate) granule-associated protein